MLQKDHSYIVFVPPGWILGGTVAEISEHHIAWRDLVFVEAVQQGTSSVSDLPIAVTVGAQKRVARSSWPIPDGSIIRRDHIVWAIPSHSLAPLVRDAAAEAIKGA